MLSRTLKIAVSTLLLTASGAHAASQASSGYLLRLAVPVVCTLNHQPGLIAAGNGYQLGELREYCNAPTGYTVSVNYAPGTMRGAVVSIGEERVVLDGSGRNTVSHAAGPRIRARVIFAEPGSNGFDTDRLDFDIET